MPSKYFFIVTLVLAANLSGAQTCVIGIKTGNCIYVGADSRVMSFRVDTRTGITDTLPPLSICKIHSIGVFNFAVIGYFARGSIEKASSACQTNGTFASVMDSYIDRYGQMVADSLTLYNKMAKAKVIELYNRKIISEILFFGYEKGRPIITKLLFKIMSFSDNEVQVGYDSSINIDTVVCGDYEAIQGFALKHSTWRDGPIKTIRKLITIEERANISVGGDIDIIKALPNGESIWVNKKKLCPFKG
jgi:hypothetical protein